MASKKVSNASTNNIELLAGWNRVRRNLVGTFFFEARAETLERESSYAQPASILLERQTYSLPSTELEREYRKLAELDEMLEKERNNYADKQQEFELRWELCSEKSDMFNELMTYFESYYAVSKLKKESDKKINNRYDHQLNEKVREVNRLKKELARMEDLKIELEQRLKNSEVYREFMSSVVKESSGEYEDISQIIMRYYELKDIRESYVKKTINQVETAFQLQKELKEITQLKELENVAGKTYNSQQDQYKNDLHISNWRKQNNLIALKDGLKRELLMTHIPQTGVYNLYLLLCDQMKQPVTLKQDQFQEQLKFIKKFLKELEKICQRSKEYLQCPSNVPILSEKSPQNCKNVQIMKNKVRNQINTVNTLKNEGSKL